jgi:hypothetical protein
MAPGDWVRFLECGRPTIAAVLYVKHLSPIESSRSRNETILTTDMGIVNVERVLEVRREG